jgi:hypothetical protein
MDTVVDRLGVRGDGSVPYVTFFLYDRFPDGAGGWKKPSRRVLGKYLPPPEVAPEKELTIEELLALEHLTLAEARSKGTEWLRMISRRIDPVADLARRAQVKAETKADTFGVVFEAFKTEKLPTERKGKEVARDIENNFLDLWRARPIREIGELDVLRVINEKKKTAPSHARNLLSEIRQFFKWAIAQRVYGISVNPCANLKPRGIVGKKKKRQRTLNNDELFALWRAGKRLPYPYRQVYQLLILVGLRLNAAADAAWSEFNPAVVRALRQRKRGVRIDWSAFTAEQLVWIIPPERMKGDDVDARPHLVPLTSDILQVLETLPVFKGDHLFTTTFGEKPVWISDKVKKDIDRRMLRTLKALARQRGDDPARVKLEPWVNHDLRRVVRSNLSRLRVTEEAREAVLAHVRAGIKAVYDVYDYADEKREALELWAARLRSIVEPSPPDNVISMKARG